MFSTVVSVNSLASIAQTNHLPLLSIFWNTYSKMLGHFVGIILISAVPRTLAQAPGLFDALRNVGASQFAAAIEYDPNLSALYNSSQVQTVFAPADDTLAALGKRLESPAAEQNGSFQAGSALTNLSSTLKSPGDIIETNCQVANLGGKTQNVVSDSRNTTSSSSARRGVSLLDRQSTDSTLPSLVRIFSGLGNNVSIIKADIPYDGGLIQVVDG